MQTLLIYICNMPSLNLSWDNECPDYAGIVPNSLHCPYYILFSSILCFLEFIREETFLLQLKDAGSDFSQVCAKYFKLKISKEERKLKLLWHIHPLLGITRQATLQLPLLGNCCISHAYISGRTEEWCFLSVHA